MIIFIVKHHKFKMCDTISLNFTWLHLKIYANSPFLDPMLTQKSMEFFQKKINFLGIANKGLPRNYWQQWRERGGCDTAPLIISMDSQLLWYRYALWAQVEWLKWNGVLRNVKSS